MCNNKNTVVGYQVVPATLLLVLSCSGSFVFVYSIFQTKALWEWAVPILKSALNNLTVSTVNDWASFYTNVSVSIKLP